MYLNYVNPSFKTLSPSNINKSVREVRKSPLYKARIKVKQENRSLLDNALHKFNSGEKLCVYDYRILMYNLSFLQQEGYIDPFIQLFINNLENIKHKESFIRPILSYIYNEMQIEDGSAIYVLLKELAMSIKGKDEYKVVIRTIKRYDYVEEFLRFIENKIVKVKEYEMLEDLRTTYFIKATDEFYIKCIQSYVIKNILVEECMDRNIEIIKSIPYEMRVDILNTALEKCRGRYKDLKIKWIETMGYLLNHPYDGLNSNWNNINKGYKEEYILYYNKNILDEAFDEGQEDKKQFFINYLKDIYNIAYFDNFRKLLVMELKYHTLISMGNSLYIYNKGIYNIHKLKEILEVNKKSECSALLKDEESIDVILHYRKQWQHVFTEELLRRGYKGER